jgi:hypothetical protein
MFKFEFEIENLKKIYRFCLKKSKNFEPRPLRYYDDDGDEGFDEFETKAVKRINAMFEIN